MAEMNENEQKKAAIDRYLNIQRIEKYGKEEIEYQKRAAKVELQMLGIPTDDLDINIQEPK